ncbi:MAG: phosphoribosyltransferase [Pseudohongiella sp.]|nr:phosphoribosyltransferase [Pseudohongiella sp.]
MERLRLRPSFEGVVQPDRAYFLVDDVSSMGTTLAELANYLQVNGGKVAGTLLLVNAGRSKEFKPAAKYIRLLEERFGDEIRQIFGVHTRALTANEAGYLVGFRTIDEIRNRLAKAEKETSLRLLSKGY